MKNPKLLRGIQLCSEAKVLINLSVNTTRFEARLILPHLESTAPLSRTTEQAVFPTRWVTCCRCLRYWSATRGENAAVGAQTPVAAPQRILAVPAQKMEKRVFVVTLRVSFEGWLVVREVFEGMVVFVSQYWTICPGLGQKRVQAPQEWFLVVWQFWYWYQLLA